MASFSRIILTAFIILFCKGFITEVSCKYFCNFKNFVHVNTLKSPLLVTPNFVMNTVFKDIVSINSLSYLYPVHNFCFLSNKEIGPIARLVCPGSFLTNAETGKAYDFQNIDRTSSIHLVYSNSRGVEYDEFSDFNDAVLPLMCSEEIHPIMKKIENYYQIGYQLDLLDFLPTMKIFFNPFDGIKVLALAKIKYTVQTKSSDPNKWTFNFNYNYKGPFFEEKNVNETLVYSKEYQHIELDKLIVKETLKNKYITDNYFMKGQLISEEDLFYVSEKKCTLFLENIVPIWKSINEGNWKRVGKIIRELAHDSKSDLTIYAGTVGELLIDNSVINIGNNYAPGDIIVPQILFKVAFDLTRKNNQGIVFVTINDPHINLTQTEIYSSSQNKFIYIDLPPKDYVKCEEIIECHQSHSELTNAYEGFTYCCALKDFHFWADLKKHFLSQDSNTFK